VHFGPPIETTGLQIAQRDQLTERVRNEVARLLAEAAAADAAATRH
jgi:hypothetical protein